MKELLTERDCGNVLHFKITRVKLKHKRGKIYDFLRNSMKMLLVSGVRYFSQKDIFYRCLRIFYFRSDTFLSKDCV